MTRNITAPPNLPDLVRCAFNRARSSDDLTYYPTQAAVLRVGGVPFQLRFSPSLAHKPKTPKPQSRAPVDPFHHATASTTPLFIADIGSAHFLVLNKFAIVPQHFILATRVFRPQTHLLEPDDFAAAWACIQAYEGEVAGAGAKESSLSDATGKEKTSLSDATGNEQTSLNDTTDERATFSDTTGIEHQNSLNATTDTDTTDTDQTTRNDTTGTEQSNFNDTREENHTTTTTPPAGLFLFFNSGPASGASQPHRHLQLLPISAMHNGLDATASWDLLAAHPANLAALPFTCFSAPVTSAHDAYAAYLRLYARACDAVAAHALHLPGTEASSFDAKPSQNTHSFTQRTDVDQRLSDPSQDTSSFTQGTNASPKTSPSSRNAPTSKHDNNSNQETPASSQGAPTRTNDNLQDSPSRPALISYNMAMTSHSILLCPRLAESASLANPRDSSASTAGKVALNGTLLAGTALVKSETEWLALRDNPILLQTVLSEVGVPKEPKRKIECTKLH